MDVGSLVYYNPEKERVREEWSEKDNERDGEVRLVWTGDWIHLTHRRDRVLELEKALAWTFIGRSYRWCARNRSAVSASILIIGREIIMQTL